MEKKLSDYIVEIETFLPVKKNEQFLKLLNNNSFNFTQAGLAASEPSIDTKIRDALTSTLGCINETSMRNIHWANTLHFYFKSAVIKYNQLTNSDIVCNIVDIQILKYLIGGFYKTHIDSGVWAMRTLSFVYFINDDYKGGQLFFKSGEKEYQIEIKKNKLVVFPSNFMFEHGVKPVTEGTKFAVVSWAQ